MICKIKALCWIGIEHKTPSVTYFYTEVNTLNKDILKIGNFVIRKSYYTDDILYTYLILNREFLSSQAGMDIKIEYVFYDELSVLLEHNKFVSYCNNHYLIELEIGEFQRYNNIDEVLDAIKFFKDTEGNQFSYISGNYRIEACNWKYIEANYFKEEKQNNSLEQTPEKEKPVKMVLPDGENIAIPINSRPPYLTIHDCCATSYTDLVQATEKVSWNEYNKKKDGGKSMFNNLMKNFKFGKMDTNAIKYSFNGIAFQTEDNDYVVYNPDMTFTNVSEMVMDIPIYVMPVPKSDVKIGDIIIHNSEFVIVQSIESKEIRVARPRTKEIVGIIPEKSVFGFDFYTKVIDFTKNFSNSATSSNPFGNLPMLMMMDNKDNNNDMLMFMMMNGCKMDFNNPMFMYMMMFKSEDKSNLLPLMMLMNQNKSGESMTGYKINNSESNIVLNTEGLNWYSVN
jgi:hypothetical protein